MQRRNALHGFITVLNVACFSNLGGALSAIVIVLENETRVQILEEAVYVSLRTNILGQGMNLYLFIAISKQKGKKGSLAMAR